VRELTPERCACGNTTCALTTPYPTHQVIELPPIARDVPHWVWHQGWCGDCGRWTQAPVPAAHATGDGPRCSALRGEVAGTDGNGRRMVQTFGASVRRVPLSWGAIPKVLDRVAEALEPHSLAIATQARHAPVHDIDETPWFLTHAVHGWWVMASDTVACSLLHPHRAKAACAALIDDGAGSLSSEGYGGYQSGVEPRQTCLAPLLRPARRLAERQPPELAACGAWALAERRRLCPMAHAPPTGGAWRAWYARLCKLIEPYHDRTDDAGRCARRRLREMDSLGVFLAQHGVEPTNNRAERALRFGVLWRKRSHGTARTKGNRWVERLLSLKETCRRQARSTYNVLVDAVTRFFHGQQPDLSWIN
jgi:transposase